jgi:hypothetical protein
MIKQELRLEASNLTSSIKQSFFNKGLIATGKTVDSIRYELTDKGFQIWGTDSVENAEFGTPPKSKGGKADYNNLLAWARAVGYPEARVSFLKYYLEKFGSRLWRGQDPRFSGNKSGVISDVISPQYLESLQKRLTFAFKIQLASFLEK